MSLLQKHVLNCSANSIKRYWLAGHPKYISRQITSYINYITTIPDHSKLSRHFNYNQIHIMVVESRTKNNSSKTFSSTSTLLDLKKNVETNQDQSTQQQQFETNIKEAMTNTTESTGASNSGDISPKMTTKEKFKRAVKDYGITVIGFHITISLMSLGFFYLLVSSGLDVVELLRSLGISETILQSRVTKGASTFVLAYAIHKIFAPVRIAVTLTATPIIVHRLRKLGFLKKVVKK